MTGKLESKVQDKTRALASQFDILLMRNNVGAFQDDRGNFIRYGLMNDSKRLNEEIKSSDLIGITPVTITADMVGKTFGVFTAIESKREGWRRSPTDKREAAQAKFHEIVRKLGGFAGFAAAPSDLWGIISNDRD